MGGVAYSEWTAWQDRPQAGGDVQENLQGEPRTEKERKGGFFSVVWRGKEKKENGAAGAPGPQGRLEET